MSCRWDNDQHTYTTPNGQPCTTDDYGDPTNHCTARRTCTNHIGPNEATCARCLGRTRTDIKQIVHRANHLLPEAIIKGINSEAANLAGPAADVEAWSWRKVTALQGRAWHLSRVEDDDETHPFTVLTLWAWMTAAAYKLTEPDVWTIDNAADLLDTQLHRIAQDPDQDFPQMARELRKCRTHLETVLADSLTPERGAFCPTCREQKELVRLQREYPHWCDDPDCPQQFHFTTDEADVWVCPRNREHWWNQSGYAEYLKERTGA